MEIYNREEGGGGAGGGAGGGEKRERDRAPPTSLAFPQGLLQPIRADVLMGLLGVGPNGALLSLHRR